MLLAAIPLSAMTLPARVKRTAADQKPGASAAAVRTKPNEIAGALLPVHELQPNASRIEEHLLIDEHLFVTRYPERLRTLLEVCGARRRRGSVAMIEFEGSAS